MSDDDDGRGNDDDGRGNDDDGRGNDDDGRGNDDDRGRDDNRGSDVIAVAADAFDKLRTRARTDLAEFRGHYHRLDGLVLLLAGALVLGAGWLHRRLVAPPTTIFSERGLTFTRSQAWLAPEPIRGLAPRLIAAELSPAAASSSLLELAYVSTLDAEARLEVRIEPLGAWSNIAMGRELDRRSRWGEMYAIQSERVRTIAGHEWLRTQFQFAHVLEKGDAPRVGFGVEYTAVDREHVFSVSYFGTRAQVRALDESISPTLRLAARSGQPLLPIDRQLSRANVPPVVGTAFASTVMVIVADLVDGRLRANGAGSGVVVGQDGSIVTNYHVLHRQNGELHQVFVIARFVSADSAPQLICAGYPRRAKLERELDLALVKCDTDLDGRTWNPRAITWPAVTIAATEDVKQGQRLWVLGYPDVGGGGLTLRQGIVEGFTGDNGATGRDYIHTDASISHGNSGGPVLNDGGEVIGIATAFRWKLDASGGAVETTQLGLVRPIRAASRLLAIAAAGWTPRNDRTSVEIDPVPTEVPVDGVRISTRILDAANGAPVPGAQLMVLRPGVAASDVDMNSLDETVIAFGRSNAQGEVHLRQPVPRGATYTVVVIARGYGLLLSDAALVLGDDAPDYFDPWTEIRLQRN